MLKRLHIIIPIKLTVEYIQRNSLSQQKSISLKILTNTFQIQPQAQVLIFKFLNRKKSNLKYQKSVLESVRRDFKFNQLPKQWGQDHII
jgi:hypothetical protein